MATWTQEELAQIGDAEELDIAARRPDGSLRPFVTIWVVRSGDDLFVRSVKGREGAWYQGSVATGNGRIRAAGVERDVAFEVPGDEVEDAVTAAYHAKYDRYGPGTVGSVVSASSVESTLRLNPR